MVSKFKALSAMRLRRAKLRGALPERIRDLSSLKVTSKVGVGEYVYFVDISAGRQQSYTEDCQVCCHPNVLYVYVDEETLDIQIDTDYEE